MNNHIDLYVEHYMDLHKYINDKICNIGYSSELLLEEGKWYDNIVHVLKKMWAAALKWFNTFFKSMANKFLPNEIRTKANSLFNQREKLFQEYQQKSIESIIDSYKNKDEDSINYFDQFLQKANILINNPKNLDNIKFMNDDIENNLSSKYKTNISIYDALKDYNEDNMKSYYQCLLYKLCNVNKFVNPYLSLNIILDRILFDLTFGIQIIDECFKDLNDLYLNGEYQNAEIITKIHENFKINDINNDLNINQNFNYENSKMNLYEYYKKLAIRINAIKMIPLRSLSEQLADDYNFGMLINNEEINKNTNFTIFETLNKHIHIENLPMFKHLIEKFTILGELYKVNGQISIDPTKLERDDKFLDKRNSQMNSLVNDLSSVNFNIKSKNIKLGNELNKISSKLIELLLNIQRQYSLSKQIDSFFLFRIDHRI